MLEAIIFSLTEIKGVDKIMIFIVDKVVEDIMLKFKCGEKLNQAIMIASYLKETNEDFSDITRQEILEVLMQLVENQTKKRKSKTKKKI